MGESLPRPLKSVLALIALMSLIMASLPNAVGWEADLGGEGRIRLLEPAIKLMSGGIWLRLASGGEVIGLELTARPSSTSPQQAPPIQIPYRSPSPKFSRNLIVTSDLGRYSYQNEPHVAVNPKDPDNVIIASHDFDVACTVIYASIDGGETWEGPFPNKPLHRDDFCSDPVVAFGRDGVAYHAFLSIGERLANLGRIMAIVEEIRVVVTRSEDGGFTWSEPSLAAWGDVRITSTGVTIISPDKPWMTVGPSWRDPSKDVIYVTYTEFSVSYPFMAEYPYLGVPTISVTIKLVRSEDGGRTWSAPVSVSPTYTYVAGEIGHEGRTYGRVVQGSYVTVAPNGRVYVAYYDALDDGAFRGQFAPTITWSDDGGESWAPPVRVTVMDELDYYLRPTVFRAWSSMFPQIAISPEGYVYVVFAANPPGPDDSDIYFTKSTDGGVEWSIPKRVNDDLSNRDQFFPAMALDEKGVIHIMWGDRRDDPKDVRYHIYYTYSNDTGESFVENGRASDYPSNPSLGIPVFIGDYFGIAASGEDVYLVWTDSRTGQRGSPNQDIAFARRRPIPLPAIFIDPPEGPAGEGITLTGASFARGERLVIIEVDGVNIGFTFTDEKGEFLTKIFAPFSGEGPHTIRAVDVLGNVAEATFYTSFGFDSLMREVEGLRKEGARAEGLGAEDVKEAVKAVLSDELAQIGEEAAAVKEELQALRGEVNRITFFAAIAALLAAAALTAAIIILLRRRGG